MKVGQHLVIQNSLTNFKFLQTYLALLLLFSVFVATSQSFVDKTVKTFQAEVRNKYFFVCDFHNSLCNYIFVTYRELVAIMRSVKKNSIKSLNVNAQHISIVVHKDGITTQFVRSLTRDTFGVRNGLMN